MPGLVFARQIATAERLIQRYGEHGCVWAEHPAVAVTGLPWAPTAGSSIENSVTLAFFTKGGEIGSVLMQLRGTDVPDGRLYGLMAAQTWTPSLRSNVTRTDGSILRPSAIDALSPNGEIIMYTVEFHS